jgi:hypothetical protein
VPDVVAPGEEGDDTLSVGGVVGIVVGSVALLCLVALAVVKYSSSHKPASAQNPEEVVVDEAEEPASVEEAAA